MSTETVILFYGAGNEYGYFSNFASYSITIEEKKFSCNEQYIMFRKAELFGDKAAAAAILATTNPVRMKQLGRTVKGFKQAVWDSQVKTIADTANLAKFTQHPKLATLLLSTGEAILAEASPTDAVWGIGVDVETGKDRTTWRGTNLLGQSLMRVRKVLRQNITE